MLYRVRLCDCGRDLWKLGVATASLVEFFCFYCARTFYRKGDQ